MRSDDGVSNSGASSPMCGGTRDRLWRYIDRELTAPEISEISGHLKACPDCGREYEARAREAKLYRLAFVHAPFGEGFVDRFRKRLAAEALPVHPASPGQAQDDRRPRAETIFFRRSRSLLGRVALAAALLAIASSMFFGLRNGSTLGSIDASDASEALLVRGDRTVPANAKALRPGDALRVPQPGNVLRLSLDDGSTVALRGLTGPGQLRIDHLSRSRGIFRANLDQGSLTANVRKRPDQEFEVWTPHAVARVIGTQFTLSVGPSETTLVVRKGKVWFRSVREAEGMGIEVVPASGTYRVIDGGRVAPLAPPEPAPPPPEAEVVEPPAAEPPASDSAEPPVRPVEPAPKPPVDPRLDQPQF